MRSLQDQGQRQPLNFCALKRRDSNCSIPKPIFRVVSVCIFKVVTSGLPVRTAAIEAAGPLITKRPWSHQNWDLQGARLGNAGTNGRAWGVYSSARCRPVVLEPRRRTKSILQDRPVFPSFKIFFLHGASGAYCANFKDRCRPTLLTVLPCFAILSCSTAAMSS